MTLIGFLGRRVGLRILAVAAALTALGLALDLLDNSRAVLAPEAEGGIADYVALRAPLILVNVLPVALLAGPILGFLSLRRASELAVLRAAGLSIWGMLARLSPLALLLATAGLLLADQAAPRAERGLIERFVDLEGVEASAGPIWTRDRESVIRIDRASRDGTRLDGLSVFALDPDGRLIWRLDAGEAEFDRDLWRLSGARLTRLPTGREAAAPTVWNTGFRPRHVRQLRIRTSTVAAAQAREALAADYAARGTDYYEFRLWRALAALPAPMLLMLLAAPAAFGPPRGAGAAGPTFLAAALGLGFVAVDGLFATFGESGAMAPALAALAPLGLFGALGLWATLLLEEAR